LGKVKEIMKAHRIGNGIHKRRLAYGKIQFSPLRILLKGGITYVMIFCPYSA